MDPLTFDYEDLHLRVDRGVFELFSLDNAEHMFRVPLRWPGELIFGIVRDPHAALYGSLSGSAPRRRSGCRPVTSRCFARTSPKWPGSPTGGWSDVESKVFEHGDVHMRVDHGIFEVFRRNRIIGSYRTPLSWVKVRAEARRGGLTRLPFGNVEQLDEPIYASTSSSRHLLITIEIPTTDEPLYRAFFTELAHLSDRPISL